MLCAMKKIVELTLTADLVKGLMYFQNVAMVSPLERIEYVKLHRQDGDRIENQEKRYAIWKACLNLQLIVLDF